MTLAATIDRPKHAPRRVPAKTFLTDAELAEVREKKTWKGVAMIAHAWLVIAAAVALVAYLPNPITYLLAVAIIGSRQLGLAILMHEGAHGLLARDQDWNLRLSQWFCAYPVGAETRAYRRYHLQHHAHTQTDDDPDLVLSAPFPITGPSYRRKFIRDLTGQTGFQQRKAQVLNSFGRAGEPFGERLRQGAENLGPQLACQLVLLAVCVAAGVWWAYLLLWIVPLLTWFQVVTRIRNIAEHAVVPDYDDPLRNTRTTIANWLERAFVAPYYVNYHLEHHLVFYVPAYNLPRVHAILMRGPLKERVEVEHGYRAVLAKATAKPSDEDRPGDLVNGARRQRAGDAVRADQAKGGF